MITLFLWLMAIVSILAILTIVAIGALVVWFFVAEVMPHWRRRQ